MNAPWKTEPDHVDWVSERGFPCAIHRVDWSGHLCGYVAVPPGHPWHGVDYLRIDAYPHGGLTFGAPADDHDASGRPFVKADREDWVVGFDCAHSGDLCPRMLEKHPDLYAGRDWEVYRDMAFVRAEVESLAALAADALMGDLFRLPGGAKYKGPRWRQRARLHRGEATA